MELEEAEDFFGVGENVSPRKPLVDYSSDHSDNDEISNIAQKRSQINSDFRDYLEDKFDEGMSTSDDGDTSFILYFIFPFR